MTITTRATLKTKFGQGDRPSGTDFEDLIDSAVNLQDTNTQALAGPITAPTATFTNLSTTNFALANVSATTVNTTSVSAVSMTTTTLSADTIFANKINDVKEFGFAKTTTPSVYSVPTNVSVITSAPLTNVNSNSFSVSANKIRYEGTGDTFTIIAQGVVRSTASANMRAFIVKDTVEFSAASIDIPLGIGNTQFFADYIAFLSAGSEITVGADVSAQASANVTFNGYTIMITRA